MGRKLRKKLRYSKRKYGVIHKFSFFFIINILWLFEKIIFLKDIILLLDYPSYKTFLNFSKVYSKRFICYFLKKQKYLLLQIKMYLIKVKLSRNATKKKEIKKKKKE